MPKASTYSSGKFVKLLFVGNSGAGKTGALTSLVTAGYDLKIIDLDNGLDALVHHVSAADPKLLDKIEFVSYRDPMKVTAQGPKVAGTPKAYISALGALEEWPEDKSDPASWGKDTILVLDSLTNVGRAAFQWARAANPTSKDPRQWYKAAQDVVEDLVANLTSDSFRTNVIVISHVDIYETADGRVKGFTSAVGKALGPKLPRFFNTMVLSETIGSGKNVKRVIKTAPTSMLDLKNPAPMKIDAEYPMETAMAKIFEKLSKT
jgi:hypothetical protein